jgi:PAS domain S-box-containing protein
MWESKEETDTELAIELTESFRADGEQFAALFSNMIDAFIYGKIEVDKDGEPVDWIFLDVNEAYARVVGLRKEQIIGKRANALFPNEQKDPADWIGKYGHVALTGEPAHFENYRQALKRWLNVSSYCPKKGYFIALFEDITERKHLEMQLQQSEHLAAIGATAGMVSHDIRNPLQAIANEVYLVKTDLTSVPESDAKKNVQESLEEIGKNVSYISKIVADLQDYARPIKPVAMEIDLETVIEDFLLKTDFPLRIKVSCHVEKDSKKIVVDADMLKRILGNLISNAVQAMPDGGKLDIHAYREGGDHIIAVKDNGNGIPEEAKDKLFMLLFTTKNTGHGFGLAVIKRMTEALGGTVSFESQEGKGTTFIIRLPPRNKR